MTIKEIEDKLTPGAPHASTIPGRDWYPSGKAEGVIYRTAKPDLVVKNGEMVAKGSTKIGDKWVAPHDQKASAIQAKAFRYIKPSSEKDRRTPFGFVHEIGIMSHLSGIVDRLAFHFPCLQKERDAGYNLTCLTAMDDICKRIMEPQVFAFLKVVPVEEGIFAIVYDPEDSIPVERGQTPEPTGDAVADALKGKK